MSGRRPPPADTPESWTRAAGLVELAWAEDRAPVIGQIADECGLTTDQVSNLIGELANRHMKAGRPILGRRGRPPQTSTGPDAAEAPTAAPAQSADAALQAGPVDTPTAVPAPAVEGWRAAEGHPIPEIAAAYQRAVTAVSVVERLLAAEGPVAAARAAVVAAQAALDEARARWAQITGEVTGDEV